MLLNVTVKTTLVLLLGLGCALNLPAQQSRTRPSGVTVSTQGPSQASQEEQIRRALDNAYSQVEQHRASASARPAQARTDKANQGTVRQQGLAAEPLDGPQVAQAPPAPGADPAAPGAPRATPIPVRSTPAATNIIIKSSTPPAPATPPAPGAPGAAPGTTNAPGRTLPVRMSAPGALPSPSGAPAAPGAIPAPAFPPPPGANPPGLGTVPPGSGLPTATALGARTNQPGLTMTNTNAAPEDQIIPAGQIKFEEADLGQVLTVYQDLTGWTVLRPSSLPQATVTIYTQTDLTRKEAIQALDSILSLNGIAMVPQGDKFVKALPSAEAPQAAQIFYNSDPADLPEAGRPVSYIARVKYASMEDVTTALEQFKSKSGNIIGIKSTQTLVIRDNAENVKRMVEMLSEIDLYVPREYKPVVIPIKYALAADIAQVLSTLTAGGGGVTSVGGGGNVGSQRLGMPGATGGGGTGSRVGANRNALSGSAYGGSYGGSGYGGTGYGSSYGGYGGGVYPRSSGVIALGNEEPGANLMPASTSGGRLRNVMPQATFQDRLKQIVNKASGEEDIVVLGQTKIIADERTNSLLIFASDEDIEMIKDIVSKLDVVLAQVLIEAVVLEVSLTDTFSFGVSALQEPAKNGKWAGVGGYRNENIPTNPWDWISGGSSGGSSNSAILPNLPGGFSYFARYNNDLDIAVQAIAGLGNVKVLSRPRVQTSHAVPCRIFVGETRPYVTGYGYGGYGGYSQSQIAQLRIGIELNVLPLINVDGLVVMDIDQRVDNVGENVKIDNNDVPTTVERSANAKVSVRDGETVILGGFIRSEKRDSNSGVPFLKDIPLLGYLFRSTSRSDQRVELMILIRPKVLQTPEDAALVAVEEKGKMPGISKAERAFNADEAKEQKKHAKEIYKREGF